MSYLGDFELGKTIYLIWSSNAIAGESITRATNGTISVYKNGSLTQTTTGVTDTEDFDALTGIHHVAIDTSADGTFYAAGGEFMVVLSAATIDGKTINALLGQFSLLNRSALRPTTAARTLDVSAGGEAGLDWANVGSPTTTVALTGTTAGLIDSAITAAKIATDAITATKIATNAIDADALATDAVTEIASAVNAGAATTADIAAAVWAAVTRTLSAGTNIALAKGTGVTGFNDIAAADVWAAVTRTLSAGTNIALAKGTGVTGFNDLSAAQVNAEVVDGLNVDTYAELASVPAATATLRQMLQFIFMWQRNAQTQTATTQLLKADDGATTVATVSTSDNGTTYTRAEAS